jgi:hypothetical protein
LITGDKNLVYQQHVPSKKVSIIVLNSLLLARDYVSVLVPAISEILAASLEPGKVVVISPPK